MLKDLRFNLRYKNAEMVSENLELANKRGATLEEKGGFRTLLKPQQAQSGPAELKRRAAQCGPGEARGCDRHRRQQFSTEARQGNARSIVLANPWIIASITMRMV